MAAQRKPAANAAKGAAPLRRRGPAAPRDEGRRGLAAPRDEGRRGLAAPRDEGGARGEDARVASMLACVRSSGLKLTPQRLAIVRELAGDPTHPTAQELFERLRPALPTMSFATVYNTLDALAAAGLCAALALSPGAARFDPNMTAHHHAVCDRCGLVRDVPCDPSAPGSAELLPAPLAAAPGFEVRAVERIYRGVCAACAKGERAPLGRGADGAAAGGRRGPASARGPRRPVRV